MVAAFKESLSGIELVFRLIFPNHKLIILSSPPYVTILISSLFLSLLKRKYILNIRDPYPEVFFELRFFSFNSISGKIFLNNFPTSYQGNAQHDALSVSSIGVIIQNPCINIIFHLFPKEQLLPFSS